jgi:hypothetical protein
MAEQVAKRAAVELSSPEMPKQTTKLLLDPELPPTTHRESMRGSKGSLKRYYPQIWTSPFYQIR